MIRRIYQHISRPLALGMAVLISSAPALAGITVSGANGITASGANGITVSGANGTTYNLDSITVRNPTGITVSGANNIIATGTDGITASGANARDIAHADGITVSGANNILTIDGADGIIATGTDGSIFTITPSALTITGVDGITVSGVNGITVSGANSFIPTGVDALISALMANAGNTGLQSVDPELALLLNRATDDSNIDAVIVYHHLPTDTDIADLQSLGVLGGTLYHTLPMIAITTTKSRIAAISHLPSVRSIYGNRTFQWNVDATARAVT